MKMICILFYANFIYFNQYIITEQMWWEYIILLSYESCTVHVPSCPFIWGLGKVLLDWLWLPSESMFIFGISFSFSLLSFLFCCCSSLFCSLAILCSFSLFCLSCLFSSTELHLFSVFVVKVLSILKEYLCIFQFTKRYKP